ncbi:hypothetical protein [Streptomyces cyslabdanicus]|uniref:hypothetical protein n=1 Tax=Streptomyces cyslabdanicus TaxID=1470456 RepID=UPI004044AA7B
MIIGQGPHWASAPATPAPSPKPSVKDGRRARRDLRFELLACADLLPRLGADDRNLTHWRDVSEAVQRQAHAALAAGWHAQPDQLDTTARAEEIRSLLERLPRQCARASRQD